jgi:hypothetical protein
MEEQLKEGREKLKGVSDAPWMVDRDAVVNDEDEIVCQFWQKTNEGFYLSKENSDFIAWSRNNMESLLDNLEVYKEVVVSLNNAYDHIQHEAYNDALSSILEALSKINHLEDERL